MSEIYPKEFKVKYVFFAGGCNKIKFIDNKLVFYNESDLFPSDRIIHKRQITPKKEEWIQFWGKINELNVWDWKEEESSEELEDGEFLLNIDGDGWDINILFEDKKLDLHCHCFGPEWTDDFFETLKELIKLDICNPQVLQDTEDK